MLLPGVSLLCSVQDCDVFWYLGANFMATSAAPLPELLL